jgi:ABC-2 type transport system permease protein
MNRLRALLVKEFIQMSRDRLTFAMMVAIPIVQLLLFGYAINTDVKHLPTVVFDQSLQQDGRDLLASFTGSGYFDVKYTAGDYEQVTELIQSGRAKVGIIIPPDFTPSLKHGRSAAVQVIVDASDQMASGSAISAAQLIGQVKSQEILIGKLQALSGGGRGTDPPVDIRIRPWYNPDFVTAYYMVPGILGIILTMTMVMITAMAIVRERERGTLEQLIVTPMKSSELMIGKIVPYILVGYIQITIALMVGIIVFDLPVRGSLGLLYLLTSFFIVASLALGIMISNVAKTQMQAMQMSFFIFLPSILLSGFMFPREAMPAVIQWVGYLIPLSYYLQILRGIILKGVGFAYLWSQVAALFAFIVAILTLSIVKFQKKIG